METLNPLVTPEQWSTIVQGFRESIAWVSKESEHSPPREFIELLSYYLANEHFAFIQREARFQQSLDYMTGSLTNRQKEIMRLVLLGMTNKAISQNILVSEATVHHEVTRILKAFSVNNRKDLIAYVRQQNNLQQA